MVIVVKRSNSQRKRVVSIIGGVVGVVLGFSAFSIGWRMYLEHRAEQEFGRMPAFQQIARWEPATYKQMKEEAVAAIRNHEGSAGIQGRVRSMVQKVALRYMKTASDEALIDYMKVNVDEMRAIAAKDPGVAFEMLYNNKADVDLTKYIDSATQQRDEAALAEIIHTGVAKEAGYQNDQHATALLNQVVTSFRTDFGDDAEMPFNHGRTKASVAAAFMDPNSPFLGMSQPVDKERATAMMIELHSRILALRTDQAAQVFRLIFSKI